MRRLRSGTLLLIAIGCVSFRGLIEAQSFRGAIIGTVLDRTSAPIAGATVSVRNVWTDLSRTVKTDDAGNFSVPELPLGAYSVTVEKQGFTSEWARRKSGDRLQMCPLRPVT
ncbi:MAG: carboxypeptidase-like regulatory domain-containing protein [Bryobacteraceae bacterium]